MIEWTGTEPTLRRVVGQLAALGGAPVTAARAAEVEGWRVAGEHFDVPDLGTSIRLLRERGGGPPSGAVAVHLAEQREGSRDGRELDHAFRELSTLLRSVLGKPERTGRDERHDRDRFAVWRRPASLVILRQASDPEVEGGYAIELRLVPWTDEVLPDFGPVLASWLDGRPEPRDPQALTPAWVEALAAHAEALEQTDPAERAAAAERAIEAWRQAAVAVPSWSGKAGLAIGELWMVLGRCRWPVDRAAAAQAFDRAFDQFRVCLLPNEPTCHRGLAAALDARAELVADQEPLEAAQSWKIGTQHLSTAHRLAPDPQLARELVAFHLLRRRALLAAERPGEARAAEKQAVAAAAAPGLGDLQAHLASGGPDALLAHLRPPGGRAP